MYPFIPLKLSCITIVISTFSFVCSVFDGFICFISGKALSIFVIVILLILPVCPFTSLYLTYTVLFSPTYSTWTFDFPSSVTSLKLIPSALYWPINPGTAGNVIVSFTFWFVHPVGSISTFISSSVVISLTSLTSLYSFIFPATSSISTFISYSTPCSNPSYS